MERIKSFMDPNYDPQGASYQIYQIIVALSAGGFLGVGLGGSRSKFEFIPEVHNDAIFAVIVEELGFLGAIILIFVFLLLLNRALIIARNAPDFTGRVLASGLLGLIAIQSLFNLASVVALVPLTGIPLPFISYGGSSLFVTMIAVGILLNIKKQS
jgi:cell division protein FtsW